MDKRRVKQLEKVEKYVNHIFSLNPDLIHFLPKEKTTFLPYTIAGWNEIRHKKYEIEGKIKIVHSPTNRGFKGTSYILKALSNLQKKYNNIEIQVIENVSHQDALALYKKADIVIDQILAGWYGAFGVEVMKMGKPLGVFIREEDLKFVPKDMSKDILDSVININPFNIEDELSKYLDNIDLLYKKSQASVDYVNKWHNPLNVAKIVQNIYES